MADLPGVGEHLQDHLEVYIQHAATQPVTMAPYFAMKARPKVGLEWLVRKTGPGATNHFEAGGFVRSNDDVAYPNLMYHFLPIAVRYDGTLPEGGGGTATRCTSARCTRTRAGRARSSAPTRARSRRCGSTTSRPSRTGASGSRRSA